MPLAGTRDFCCRQTSPAFIIMQLSLIKDMLFCKSAIYIYVYIFFLFYFFKLSNFTLSSRVGMDG